MFGMDVCLNQEGWSLGLIRCRREMGWRGSIATSRLHLATGLGAPASGTTDEVSGLLKCVMVRVSVLETVFCENEVRPTPPSIGNAEWSS